MRRQSRQHPLQSFRFWFLVIAGVCTATAWKMGWLPLHQHGEHMTAEVPPPPPRVDGAGFPATDLGGIEDLPAQSEPAIPLAGDTRPGAYEEQPLATREIPSVSPVEQNPFGVAHPQFTAVDEPPADPRPVFNGGIQLTGNEEPAPTPSPVPTPSTAPAISPAPAPMPAQTRTTPRVDLTEVKTLLAAGTPDADIEAHRILSEMYWSKPEARPELMEDLEATARRIYFLPQPHYMDPYVVQPGDNLESIAEQYDISWQYLARLNRITDARRLRAGQTLKVIRGPFTAVVDLSDYELTIHAHGYFVYRFPIGIGRDGSTPEGTFVVEEKLVNPTYYGPDGVIEADDELNPLGERWISIGDSYGIHGTIDPESIGRSESRGCIRMHNQDVAIVYDLLTPGSEVIIQR